MARPIYSWLFDRETLATGGFTLVPLDPAFTYVIRDITGQLIAGSAGTISLEVQVGADVLWHFPCPQNWVKPFSWQGHVVVPGATTSILVNALGSAGSVAVAVSGYRLSA